MEKGIIDINNSKYPQLLKEIDDPPQLLYYKGNWDFAIFDKCLAVVGSRRMTSYGKLATSKLVSGIAASGITIVSGFMYGVDATAHKAALSVGGRTIAIMPCGIDIIYPQYQEDLYNEILENNGLIISEYPGEHPPLTWVYPRRNRIVVGISQGTMVVEAAKKSGSLISADLTKKYNRKLFAVPGSVTSALSEGTLQLIKENANMVTTPKDVLIHYDLVDAKTLKSAWKDSNLTLVEESIMKKLQEEPMEIDSLSRFIEVPASEISASLSLMQLKGLLFEEEGKYYVN